MKFKYYFNNLKIKDKILLFLLIPLFLFLFFMLFEEYILKKDKLEMQQKIKVLKLINKDFKSKSTKPTNIEIIKYIEKLATSFKIQILTTKINQKYFEMKTIGGYQNSMNFLRFIEQSTEIKMLDLYKEKSDTVVEVRLKFYKLVNISTITRLDDIPNPFIQVKHRDIAQSSVLNLLAIVGQSVCINDIWYQKNDKVGKYTIDNIVKDYVELKDKNNMLKLEIYSDE